MTIYVMPADTYGCGFYRMIWPARALSAQGERIRVIMPDDAVRGALLQGRSDETGRTVAASAPRDATALILQRITHSGVAQAIPLWRKEGLAVVMDLDDDLAAIDPGNPAWAGLHPGYGKPGYSWHVAAEAAREATWITVSTPELAKRYGHPGRVSVLPNAVPGAYLRIEHTGTALGWAGSAASHPADLPECGSAMAQLAREGFPFRVTGPPQGIADALRMSDAPWSASGGVPIAQWPYQIASDLAVGIAPLADTRFNAAKSWLKPLEYASLGVVPVMSPRREYAAIAELGIGVTARKPKDWLRECRRLMTDHAYREDLAARGRDQAALMTVERQAWRWLEAWLSAISCQGAGSR